MFARFPQDTTPPGAVLDSGTLVAALAAAVEFDRRNAVLHGMTPPGGGTACTEREERIATLLCWLQRQLAGEGGQGWGTPMSAPCAAIAATRSTR